MDEVGHAVSGIRVAIDARPLSHPQAGGFRSYVRALLIGLCERAAEGKTDEKLLLYVDRPLSAAVLAGLPAGTETRIVGRSRLRADWGAFPRLLKSDAPDLILGTSNYLPPSLPRNIVRVVTIHDAMGIARYDWDVKVKRNARERFVNRYWAWLTKSSARAARLVLTVSCGSRDAVAMATAVPKDRFRVVYNGVDAPALAEPPERDRDTVLAIESPDPRKNVALVYRALSGVESQLGRPVRLRVVTNGERAAERVRRDGPASAEVLSGLNDMELAKTYARSTVLVWPSRWEGFGLPPLEAMAQGCAVVSSNAPVMPEILGDIPLYAGPDAPDAFAEQITYLLNDDDARNERASRGRTHAANFTCHRMADQTVAAWYEALGR